MTKARVVFAQTSLGYLTQAVLLLLVTYGAWSWAIDSGSLFLYMLIGLLLATIANRLFKALQRKIK